MMNGSSRVVATFAIVCSVFTLASIGSFGRYASAEVTTQISAAGDAAIGTEGLAPIRPGSDVSPLIEEAKKWIASRQIQRAQQSLEPLRSHPEIMDVDVLLADLLMKSGMAAEGRQLLERAACELPPRLAIYLAFSELAVRERRWFDGWNLIHDAQLIAAPEHWSDELKIRVQQRLVFLDAVCNEKRFAWDQARRSYETLAGQVKGTARIESLVGLGRCWFHLKNEQQALVAWTTAIAETRDLVSPYQLLADLYEQQGSLVPCEQAYRNGLEQSHGVAAESLRLNFARHLLQQNQTELAKSVLAVLPETAPTAALTQPAAVDRVIDDQDRERQTWSRLSNQRVLLGAVIARMERRLTEAQAMLTKLHRLEPSSDAVSNHLAAVLVESDDEASRGRALQIAEASVRNRPQSADAWAMLGWVQLSLGDPVAAETSLANAVRIAPLARDTLYFMARLKKASGDDEQARQWMDRYEQASGPRFFD